MSWSCCLWESPGQRSNNNVRTRVSILDQLVPNAPILTGPSQHRLQLSGTIYLGRQAICILILRRRASDTTKWPDEASRLSCISIKLAFLVEEFKVMAIRDQIQKEDNSRENRFSRRFLDAEVPAPLQGLYSKLRRKPCLML